MRFSMMEKALVSLHWWWPGERLGPEPGICAKIVTVSFLLLITWFGMAKLFYIPEWSPGTPVATHLVTNIVSAVYSKFRYAFCWTLAHVWTAIFQLVVLMTPRLGAKVLMLWIWGTFHASAWVVWWTMYLASRWRYLSVRDRSFLDLLRKPDHEKSLHDARYEYVPGIQL